MRSTCCLKCRPKTRPAAAGRSQPLITHGEEKPPKGLALLAAGGRVTSGQEEEATNASAPRSAAEGGFTVPRLRVLVSFPRNNVYFSLMDEAYTDSSAFAGCTALFLLKESYRGNSSRNRINERTPPPPRVCTPGTDSCCRAPRLGAVCRTNAAGHVHVPLAACSHSRPAGWHCARAQAVSSLPSGSGAKESGLEAGHRAEHRGCLALSLPEGTLRPQQPQALAACPHAPLTLAPEDDDKTPNK